MNELDAIVKEAERLRSMQQAFALATITRVEGSAYRRPGTRMLVSALTATCGTISAGCLEGEVAEHAARVLETGRPEVLHFNEAPDDAGGFGTGCGGRIEVLVERMKEEGALELLGRCLRRRETGVLATVTAGPQTVRAGQSVLFRKGGCEGAVPKGDLGNEIERAAGEVLRDGRTVIRKHESPGGSVDVLYEVVRPSIRLVIFGTGPDVVPVVRFARGVGWQVIVAGTRPAAELSARFPDATETVFLMHPEQAAERVAFDERSAAVVMNHHYVRDRTLLQVLSSSPVPYVGVLGPRSRTDRMLAEIHEELDLERIAAPVGLDIGTETPEEIALSIVSEIQAILNGRPGGRLRDRGQPIHDPVSEM